MFFFVQYVGEIVSSSDNVLLSAKTLSYKFDKNLPLTDHLINIHRSLKTIGVEVEYESEDYELRVCPFNCDKVKENHPFPITLTSDELVKDMELIVEWQKKLKKQQFILEFILKVELRVLNCIKSLKNESKIKSVVFYLRKELMEPSFCEEFVEKGGMKIMLDHLSNLKGNALSYSLIALEKLLRNSIEAQNYLKQKKEGIVKIFSLIKNPLLSVCRSSLDVLNFLCSHSLDFWQIIYEIILEKENIRNLVLLLNSADLNTRIYALKLINNLLSSSPTELILHNILDSLNNININLFLQKSLWIQHQEMNKQIKSFEKASGISVFNLEMDFTKISPDTELLLAEIKRLNEEIGILKSESEFTSHFSDGQIEKKCFDPTHESIIKQNEELKEKNSILENKLASMSISSPQKLLESTVSRSTMIITPGISPSPSSVPRASRAYSHSPSSSEPKVSDPGNRRSVIKYDLFIFQVSF